MFLVHGRTSRRGIFAMGLALSILIAPSLVATEAPETGEAHVRGRVLAAATGSAMSIPGIGVQLSHPSLSAPRQATTDGLGRWSFSGLEPGRYKLDVQVAGFAPFSEEVNLEAGEERELDVELAAAFGQAVSVTATRTRRATQDVPAAISVIDSDTIEATPMTNIAQALAGTPSVLIESKNQGYDARLVIRGSGLKARYGIREIMLLLNGIPITDPDSLTRLDFVDTQLIDRIEVVPGPNSTLWGINSTGGVLNVITKNPLDSKGGIVRFDAGEFGARSYQANYTAHMGDLKLI
jgi:outer membrane receptor protein involved in Fe transport